VRACALTPRGVTALLDSHGLEQQCRAVISIFVTRSIIFIECVDRGQNGLVNGDLLAVQAKCLSKD
jgi:hypothetical protein